MWKVEKALVSGWGERVSLASRDGFVCLLWGRGWRGGLGLKFDAKEEEGGRGRREVTLR